MRKYIEPKIKAVILDPEQAILQVCKAAGVWIYANQCVYEGTVATSAGCSTGSAKGATFTSVSFAADENPGS